MAEALPPSADATQASKPVVHGYVVALSAMALALVLRWLLDPWLRDAFPLVTLYGAVAAGVWFGGWQPAAVAALLGGLVANVVFVEPRGALELNTPQLVGMAAYALTCALIIGFGEQARRAHAYARQQRELVRITLASIGDAVISTDTEGRISSMNSIAESLTGWSVADARGQPLDSVFQIINERSRKPVGNPVLHALRTGTVVGLANHTILIRRDGSELQIDDSAAPIRDDLHQIVGGVLVFRDISERRVVERRTAAQLDAARLLAAIVTSSDDAIVSKSLDGVIESWNEGAERIFGYSAEEAVGRHISLVIPRERLGEEDEILRQLRAGERIDHFSTVRRHKDGHELHVSITVSPVRDANGRVVGASKIARDISAQKQSEARVAQLVEDLRQADRRKDEFLATLAHELRGPLAPVRNSLEILKRADSDAGLRVRARGMLDRQVAQMERLVDDLLDVARITRNRLELRMQDADVVELLQQAIEAGTPMSDAAQHDLTFDAPAESLMVRGDPARLVQVFGNLINNANKYTEPGGRIELSLRREGSWARVSVLDNGIGISSELLPRVFDIFAQGDQAPERTQGGLGIGLTLVKRLVGMHGGSVEARSEGSGRGSEFIVRLPLAEPQAAAVTPSGPSAAASDVPTRRVLVVDDLEDSADSLAMLLRLDKHSVSVARDGEEALQLAEQVRPEIVLLDIGLPRMSGYEVCRRLRKEPWGRDMRIFALTGWGQEGDRRQSQEAGFDGHLVKPVSPEQLREIVRARSSPRGRD